MNEVNSIEASIFPGTPTCATNNNKIAPKFLTMMVVAQCRAACEELADSLGCFPCVEHDIINDCLAACDEYTNAMARESLHTVHYATWCSQRCNDLREACLNMDSAVAESAAKWLNAVSKQMNREIIAFQRNSKTMRDQKDWDSPKGCPKGQVIAFDPFESTARARVSGDK